MVIEAWIPGYVVKWGITHKSDLPLVHKRSGQLRDESEIGKVGKHATCLQRPNTQIITGTQTLRHTVQGPHCHTHQYVSIGIERRQVVAYKKAVSHSAPVTSQQHKI